MFFQQGNTFSKGNFDNWVLTFEWLEFELFIDGFKFISESFLEIAENIWE